MNTLLRRLFLSILSGILLSLAWNNVFPALIFISLVPLLILEKDFSDSYPAKSGNLFGLTWLSFIIWNGIAGWWVGYASLSGAIALLCFNSFLYAFVFWLYHISKSRLKIIPEYLLLIAYWLAFEYLYQRTAISWPWFNLGNIFGNMIELVQWYEYTGTLGGTLWILLVNIVIAEAINGYEKNKSFRLKIITAATFLLLPSFISMLIYYRYHEISHPVKIAVIQPNIDPYHEKFGELTSQEQLNIILSDAGKASNDEIDYYVGPETAILGKNNESKLLESHSIASILNFLKKNPGAKFVIGAETQREYLPGENITGTARKSDSTNVWEDRYNSALQIESTGNIQIYHKSKLVIGVEKMPFPGQFKFFEKLQIRLGGTFGSLGDQDFRETFSATDSTSVAPIICFESIYGQYVTDYVKAGATILFVITNDGWWKNSTGTWQHLNLSRLRAIETRRSIARSANTGISALINQKGEIEEHLAWGKRGSLVGHVNNNKKLTFYVQYGDYLGIIACLMSLISFGSLLILKWSKKTKENYLKAGSAENTKVI